MSRRIKFAFSTFYLVMCTLMLVYVSVGLSSFRSIFPEAPVAVIYNPGSYVTDSIYRCALVHNSLIESPENIQLKNELEVNITNRDKLKDKYLKGGLGSTYSLLWAFYNNCPDTRFIDEVNPETPINLMELHDTVKECKDRLIIPAVFELVVVWACITYVVLTLYVYSSAIIRARRKSRSKVRVHSIEQRIKRRA